MQIDKYNRFNTEVTLHFGRRDDNIVHFALLRSSRGKCGSK
jgi:hypothetical protein